MRLQIVLTSMHMPGDELVKMIADYMEKGFLENIIDMFLHDSSLYAHVGQLIQDERVRVRVGVTAMIEELSVRDRENAIKALPGLLEDLRHGEAVVRGDAVNLVGIIGHGDVLQDVERLLNDPDPNVRMLAEEAISDIKKRDEFSAFPP